MLRIHALVQLVMEGPGQEGSAAGSGKSKWEQEEGKGVTAVADNPHVGQRAAEDAVGPPQNRKSRGKRSYLPSGQKHVGASP